MAQARKLMHGKSNCECQTCQLVADALLAVQSETARECAEMAGHNADECAEYGNIVGRAVADNLMLEIRARFGLEGK